MDMSSGIQLGPYLVILVMFLLGAGLGVGVSGLALFLGPKKPNKAKTEPYECGLPILSTASEKISIKFYLVAIIFIVFDIETIFLYLWSRLFDDLGWFGMVEIGLFALALFVGLAYVLGHGVLRWSTPKSYSID